MQRKSFIKNGIIAGGLSALVPTQAFKTPEEEKFTGEEIKEFVFAAHADFDKTKRIVDQHPLILNCTNQFKKGDFETAIGGASHMGRRDIADMLVARGARLDIFNLTFLGFIDAVKSMIAQYPHLLNAPGPHGFTLLHHANVGKHEEFAMWLKDQGLAETMFKDVFD